MLLKQPPTKDEKELVDKCTSYLAPLLGDSELMWYTDSQQSLAGWSSSGPQWPVVENTPVLGTFSSSLLPLSPARVS